MWFVHQIISRRIATTGSYISSQYTTTGYQLTDVDVVVCVLLFTMVYAILRACCFLYA